MNLTFHSLTPEASILEPLRLKAFDDKGIEVWIKRDDLIHPVISGNKWRKLKYLVAYAQQNGYKKLVSFGGAYSNHLPALAAAAKLFGLQSAAFVRGEELNIYSNPRLIFCDSCEMELNFVSREAYRNKEDLYKNKYTNEDTLMVDEGGKSSYAVQGCAEIIKEIEMTFDHIVLPIGTGTTMAGVALGCKQYQPSAKVHGIVVLKGAEYLEIEVKELLARNLNNYIFYHQYHEGGYAKRSEQLDEIIKEFYLETGIETEYIYSGKMISAVYKMLEAGVFKKGESLVLLHTGGVWGGGN